MAPHLVRLILGVEPSDDLVEYLKQVREMHAVMTVVRDMIAEGVYYGIGKAFGE